MQIIQLFLTVFPDDTPKKESGLSENISDSPQKENRSEKDLLTLDVQNLDRSLRRGHIDLLAILGEGAKLGHGLSLAAAGAEAHGASDSENESGKFHVIRILVGYFR